LPIITSEILRQTLLRVMRTLSTGGQMMQTALKSAHIAAAAAHGPSDTGGVTMPWTFDDTKTLAGEPLSYPSTQNPVISANVLVIPPGTITPWMIHPVQPFLYVLEGTLTVEFAADGLRHSFNAGQAFLQTRTHWHRGRNDGAETVRLLGVFVGAKDVPNMLHAPAGKAVGR
jgi:quercetin dioxygenase-like cupin family protein